MANESRVGSNYLRHSGDDGRRGFFSKLPPLSIPNGLRRLTSHSQRDADASSTSPAPFTPSGFGAKLAKITSKMSMGSLPKKSSTASTVTPTSALPTSGSSQDSPQTATTTPSSGAPDTNIFTMRPGVLPDTSPDKRCWPNVHTDPNTKARVVTWYDRYSTAADGVRRSIFRKPSEVIITRPSKSSLNSSGPRVHDATRNRISAGEGERDEWKYSPENLRNHPPRQNTLSLGSKGVPAEGEAHVNWDPRNPGHDAWTAMGRWEQAQQRSNLVTDLSTFNMSNAQSHKPRLPMPDVGPKWEGDDGNSDPFTLRDVGGLVDGASYFHSSREQNIDGRELALRMLEGRCPERTTYDRTPYSTHSNPDVSDESEDSVSDGSEGPESEEEEQENAGPDFKPEASIVETADGNHRHTVAIIPFTKDDDDVEDCQSFTTASDTTSTFLSCDDPYGPPFLTNEEVSHSIRSRTQKDSALAEQIKRRTSSMSAMIPNLASWRSRGESIGLADCSKDPCVLAAGREPAMRKCRDGHGERSDVLQLPVVKEVMGRNRGKTM